MRGWSLILANRFSTIRQRDMWLNLARLRFAQQIGIVHQQRLLEAAIGSTNHTYDRRINES
jgi:hypothetical protein